MMSVFQEIAGGVEIAQQRIGTHIVVTPLLYSARLSEILDSHISLKLENLQYTGSFKVRGALNKILGLQLTDAGIVTASTGNHARGVGHALSIAGSRGVVYVPENASSSKLVALGKYPLEIRTFGEECGKSERHAREVARRDDLVYVSPYNDPDIVAGQGTIGREIWEANPDVEMVFVCIGGGGLISGIGGYLKAKNPKIRIVGCLPENSPVMYESIRAGRVVDMPVKDTLSDGSSGGMDQNSITFEYCREIVDDYVLVSEKEIRDNILNLMQTHHIVVEGAAAVPVAALYKRKGEIKGKKVAVVICGGNIGLDTVGKILSKGSR